MGIQTALVVDDSRSARYILQRLLERRHIHVDLVDSAQQAFDYLREHRPDVVFMDDMMPGMEGSEAVERLADDPVTRAIPIIMYTAREYATEPPVPHRGVIGVLSKPFTPEDVNALLEQLEAAGAAPSTQTPPAVARLVRSPTGTASVATAEAAAVDAVAREVSLRVQDMERLRSELLGVVKAEVRLAVDEWLGETLERNVAEQVEAQQAVWLGRLNELRAEQARFQGQILEQRIPRLLDVLERRVEQRVTQLQASAAADDEREAFGPLQRAQIVDILRAEVTQAAHRPARQAARQATAELIRSDLSALNLRVDRLRRRISSTLGFGVSILLATAALAYLAGTMH